MGRKKLSEDDTYTTVKVRIREMEKWRKPAAEDLQSDKVGLFSPLYFASCCTCVHRVNHQKVMRHGPGISFSFSWPI